eukprot:c39383_g1_i1 orf=39-251(+)
MPIYQLLLYLAQGLISKPRCLKILPLGTHSNPYFLTHPGRPFFPSHIACVLCTFLHDPEATQCLSNTSKA